MSNIIDSIRLSGVTYTIQGTGGGGIPESAFTAYTAATDSRIAEDEEVTAAGLNALNSAISGISGNNVVELTQAQYDVLVTGGTVDPTAFYIITDAQPTDISQYWTSAQTNSAITSATSGKVDASTYTAYTAATDTALASKANTATTYTKTEVDNAITAATSTKQDALVSGTNIKTINNESILGSGNIDIQGGGKAVSGGTNISVTTGETADTINCTLSISAGTGTNSLIVGYNTSDSFWKPTASGKNSIAHGIKCTAAYEASIATGYYNEARANHSIAQGYHTTTYGGSSHSEGWDSVTMASYSHAEGNNCITSGESSHAEGIFTNTSNKGEHSEGWYNVTRKNSTTFGDSGNTLFSVGNGTAANARHNAFEIRQNGDIYLSLNGQDVKLQDQLGGGSITVDTALDSGSTNPVENRVIYNKIDEVEQVTAAALNNINDRLSEDEEVTAAALNNLSDNFGGLKLMKLTQNEYNALSPNYDSNTLYVIVN